MLKKIDEKLLWVENWIMILTGIAVCLIIFINALMRYIFKADFYGNEEITLFCAFWLYFTGSSVAAKKDTHINADMISMFSHNQTVISIVHLIKNLISLIMCAIATYWAFNYVMWTWSVGTTSSVFKLPIVIGQIPIQISFFLWTLYLIRDTVISLKELKKPADVDKEG